MLVPKLLDPLVVISLDLGKLASFIGDILLESLNLLALLLLKEHLLLIPGCRTRWQYTTAEPA